MKQTKTFWQLVFLALALTLCFIFSVLFLILLRLDQQQTKVVYQVIYENIYYLLALITVVPVALWVIFEICYTRFYLPLKKIPAEISVIFTSNPSYRLDYSGNHNIRELSEVINQFAETYENQGKQIAKKISKAMDTTENERNLLASILAELPTGLVICNIHGRILLFNSQAKMLFTENKLTKRSEYFLGLGRSIFHILDKSLIEHALAEIDERLNSRKKRVASYFTALLGEDPILFEVIPVLNQERIVTAFILSLQNITDNINRYETINSSFQNFARSLAESCSHVGEICSSTEMARKIDIKNVQQSLTEIYDYSQSTQRQVLEAVFEPIPLTKLELNRFLFVLQKTVGYELNIRLNIQAAEKNKRILGDMYSFITALVVFFEKLGQLTSLEEFDISVKLQEKEVVFDITWEGEPVNCIDIERLADEKIQTLSCLSYVFRQNKAAFEAVSTGAICSQVRVTATAELPAPFPGKRRSPVIAGSRPEYYDFSLFTVDEDNRELLNCPLESLTYSAIDTETTGLDPGGGDEILAIGAVRIVKGRILHADCFEQLINPVRDIPFDSYRIHGIDPAMVVDKPTINEVLPLFKRYVSNTVILGHDVAFDMKMFRLKEKSSGVAFSNPVLDTLLLSAMLHPIDRRHNLESIAKRLGVTIIGRHTALGDAMAAAEIFLKLIPLLQSKNIITLKEAINASKRTYFSRLRY